MLTIKNIVLVMILSSFSLPAISESRTWLQPVANNLLDGTHWGVAATTYGIDPWLLFAVSLEETGEYAVGRGITPWPYTTHRNGVVIKHESFESAARQIRAWEANGVRNYDVGPFQINRRWHGKEFTEIEDMLDVGISAHYVAKLLKAAIEKSRGDAFKGVGLLRSWQGGQIANDYAERIKIIRSQLPGGLDWYQLNS